MILAFVEFVGDAVVVEFPEELVVELDPTGVVGVLNGGRVVELLLTVEFVDGVDVVFVEGVDVAFVDEGVDVAFVDEGVDVAFVDEGVEDGVGDVVGAVVDDVVGAGVEDGVGAAGVGGVGGGVVIRKEIESLVNKLPLFKLIAKAMFPRGAFGGTTHLIDVELSMRPGKTTLPNLQTVLES